MEFCNDVQLESGWKMNGDGDDMIMKIVDKFMFIMFQNVDNV